MDSLKQMSRAPLPWGEVEILGCSYEQREKENPENFG